MSGFVTCECTSYPLPRVMSRLDCHARMSLSPSPAAVVCTNAGRLTHTGWFGAYIRVCVGNCIFTRTLAAELAIEHGMVQWRDDGFNYLLPHEDRRNMPF